MPVSAQTFPPAPGGMNVALAPQEIDDTEAQYLQDGLLDLPGVARRRGPVTAPIGGPTALPRPGTGLVITIDPAGAVKYAALSGTGANGYLTVWSDDLSATVDLSWPHALPTDPASGASSAYRLVSATPGAGGGTWIGTASDYGATNPLQALAFWHGGNKADYATGTISFTRGSTTVTGAGTAWLANATPGMFLFANTDDAGAGTFTDTLIGTVLSVNSDTSITLTKPAPYSGSAGRAYTLRSIRGFIPKVVKGRITCDTGSTTVSGGNTKFQAQGLGSGTWNLYRASDLAWIGKVSAVSSDISLTLAANAAISMADDAYVAIRGDWTANDKSISITLSTSKVGWITASYAERQWFFANGAQFDKTFRGWFADSSDPEAVDLSEDGNWIPISSTSDTPEPIRGAVPTYNAVLVMKDSETFAIYGTSPDDFSAKKLEDDGALSTMVIQPYGGGAVWAGRNGVYFYDGVQVLNLTERKFGDVYKNTIRSLDQTRYRAWSMIARNHYWLFLEDLDPTISVVKGNTSTTPNHWVLVINLDTGAVDLHTNVGIRGSVVLPAQAGRDTWFLVNDVTAGVGRVISANSLYDGEGVDSYLTVPGGTLGPDFYFHSKKFNAGDDVWLKRFKQFAMHYLAQGGALNIDVVLGLNNVGRTLSTQFPATVLTWSQLQVLLPNWSSVATEYATWSALVESVFLPKRVRFTKKDHHMSIRIWQASAAMTRVRVGPFNLAYKHMRRQRVK